MNSSETMCMLRVLTCLWLGMCCPGMPKGWLGADMAWRASCDHTGCPPKAFHQLSQSHSHRNESKSLPIQLGPKSGWEHQAGVGSPELDGGIMTLRGRGVGAMRM